MVFCGQCGLHLPAGTTRCPRCGAVSDTSMDMGGDSFSTDAPTVASLTYAHHPQANLYPDTLQASIPFLPPEQHKLVLRSNDDGNSATGDGAPTSAMNAPDYRTRTPVDYQTQPTSWSGVSNANYPVQPSNTYQSRGYTPDYTGNIPPGGAAPAVVYPSPMPMQQKKRRTLPLLFAVLGLLLLVGVSAFFVVTRFHLLQTIGNSVPHTTGNSVSPVSHIEQAKSVVNQYYDDINNKNYQHAYSLWKWGANAPSFSTFQNGYVNTEHDALTIRDTTEQSDGTVKVLLTIVATERVGSGTQQHTYVGYYIVGQDAGTWKILRGVLNRV